jgi:hypothetical protein
LVCNEILVEFVSLANYPCVSSKSFSLVRFCIGWMTEGLSLVTIATVSDASVAEILAMFQK